MVGMRGVMRKGVVRGRSGLRVEGGRLEGMGTEQRGDVGGGGRLGLGIRGGRGGVVVGRGGGAGNVVGRGGRGRGGRGGVIFEIHEEMVELLRLHVAKVSEFHLFPVHKVDDRLDGGLIAGKDLALLMGNKHLDLVDLLARPEDVLGVVGGRVLRGGLEDISEDGA